MPDPEAHDENPLAARYASRAMVRIFSAGQRFRIWRRLWIALAEAEKELGLPITDEQLLELREHAQDIDFERARVIEGELRHDVMAHVMAWREQCPRAGGILHLGATSCFITDNSELVQMRAALELLQKKLRQVMRHLRTFCLAQRKRPTVGYTHFQVAQFTTVGKRAAMWLQDLLLDHQELEGVAGKLRFRGVKGTTGTQDSFLKLFQGNSEKVVALDRLVAAKMGFEKLFLICGQTYTRKQDSRVLNGLSSLAQSAGKISSDLRLLCHLQEIEEPFLEKQIGSSAMAYKRNPMRSERVAGLCRYLIILSQNAAHTASTQWLERTLDDSANRRLSISQGFLAADGILELLLNLIPGLVVREAVIARHVAQQLPFIASEEVLMEAVRAGGDRQELHELIRVAAREVGDAQKEAGRENDLLERLARHEPLAAAVEKVQRNLDPERFTGRAAQQVEFFLAEEVDPVLAAYPDEDLKDELSV